jgi:multicomponent Na+:H+ antiporter subunit D
MPGLDRHPVVLLASTLLNAAYFVPVVYQGVLRQAAPRGCAPSRRHEASAGHGHSLCLTAALSVFLGIYPDFFMQFAQAVVK